MLTIILAGLVSNDEQNEIVDDIQTRATLNVGATQTYKTIQAACDAATGGDTILVDPGTYNENVYLNKSLTLTGTSPDNTFIKGRGAMHVVLVNAVNCVVENFDLSGATSSWWSSGVAGNFDTLLVQNCNINNNSEGFHANFISDWQIKNNTIKDNNEGIYSSSSSSGYIENNTFVENTNAGIQAQSSSNLVLRDNVLINNPLGIYFSYSSSLHLRKNLMYGNGIYIFGGLAQWNSHDIDTSNKIMDKPVQYVVGQTGGTVPLGAGQVILAGCDQVTVENQVLNNGTCGVLVGEGNHNIIKNNFIGNQSRGAVFITGSPANHIHNNTIWNSTIAISASEGEQLFDNEFKVGGVLLSGTTVEQWDSHSIDTTNTVNGKPIRYLKNETSGTIPADTGQVILAGCSNITVDGLDMDGGYGGVSIGFSNDNNVTNNILSDGGVKLMNIYFSDRNLIKNNVCYNTSISVQSSDSTTIEDNIFTGTNSIGFNLFNSLDTKILRNEIGRFGQQGIYLWASPSVIVGNRIHNNSGVGLDMRADGCSVEYNTFADNNLYSIMTVMMSQRNEITNNNFYNNNQGGVQATDEAFMIQNNWNTSISGNYWNDWTAPDANANGIVDNPYDLDGASNNADNFPLADPVSGVPVILTVDDNSATEEVLYENTYTATDPDTSEDSLIWSWNSNAGWLAFNGVQALSGTPMNSDVGSYWVNISVSDGVNIDFTNFTIDVQNTNDAPVIVGTDVTTAYEDVFYGVDYNVTDMDLPGDSFTWSIVTTVDFLSINSTGYLSGTPGIEHAGNTYPVEVNVSDNAGGYANRSFDLTVVGKNHAPTLNVSAPDITMDEDGVDFTFNISAWFIDIDGDDLVYSADGQVNITIDVLANGTVMITPLPDWFGEEMVAFSANDSEFEISDDVKITVLPVNDAPVNNNFTYLIWDSDNNNVTFTANPATDVEGDALTYNWDLGDGTKPLLETFNHTYPKVNVSVDYNVTLIVTDGNLDSLVCTQTVTIPAFIEPPEDLPNTTADDDDDDDDTEPPVNETDTDADGLPDSWELTYFSDLSQGAEDDPDMDNLTNIHEYELGLSPIDPDGNVSWDDDLWDDDDDDAMGALEEDKSGGTAFSRMGWVGVVIGVVVIVVVLAIIGMLVVVGVVRRNRAREQQLDGLPYADQPIDEQVFDANGQPIQAEGGGMYQAEGGGMYQAEGGGMMAPQEQPMEMGGGGDGGMQAGGGGAGGMQAGGGGAGGMQAGGGGAGGMQAEGGGMYQAEGGGMYQAGGGGAGGMQAQPAGVGGEQPPAVDPTQQQYQEPQQPFQDPAGQQFQEPQQQPTPELQPETEQYEEPGAGQDIEEDLDQMNSIDFDDI